MRSAPLFRADQIEERPHRLESLVGEVRVRIEAGFTESSSKPPSVRGVSGPASSGLRSAMCTTIARTVSSVGSSGSLAFTGAYSVTRPEVGQDALPLEAEL
ncbi:MAG: hypothetical protein DMD81_23585 [Candidatus Rokuibacteriota bacterium]|nr:MAG: hypothetical protein DMD81_23585 [Candidatus Rokubacteria bacterium]